MEKHSEMRWLANSTRGHNYKLYKPFAQLKACSDFYGVQAINCWNSLLHDIVNATSLSILRITLTNIGETCYILIVVNDHCYT